MNKNVVIRNLSERDAFYEWKWLTGKPQSKRTATVSAAEYANFKKTLAGTRTKTQYLGS